MNQISIANILLTRRCNLSCEYCRLVKDIPEVSEYPLMSHYKNNELTSGEWIEIIRRLKANNPNVFLVIYGGEPFIYDGLSDILNYCHNENIFYTVISNNTDGVQNRIEKVRNEIGGIFRGFTSSVDPLVLDPLKDCSIEKIRQPDFNLTLDKLERIISNSSDIYKKSYYGLKRLIEMKKSGKAEDVVAEITLTKDTVKYLYNLVKLLSDNNIYSSITVLDDQKTKYYDFSSIVDTNLLVEKTQEVRDQFDKILNDKSLLIHIPELLNNLYDMLPSNGCCELNNDIHNVTIDADGTFRLCLRIRGTESVKLSLDSVLDFDGTVQKEFVDNIRKDFFKYCKLCNWTCSCIMSKLFTSNIIDH